MLNWELTKRELAVLEQASRGLSIKKSAEESKHEETTIKFHRTSIIQKLGAKNMVHAVAIAYRERILNDKIPVCPTCNRPL